MIINVTPTRQWESNAPSGIRAPVELDTIMIEEKKKTIDSITRNCIHRPPSKKSLSHEKGSE